MKQGDKELVLRDLCGRLRYGVKMNHIASDEHSPNTLIGIAKDMITLEGLGGYECVNVEHYKPYLFPLSSMTEEQIEEAKTYFWKDVDYGKSLVDKGINCFYPCFNILEFYHKYHLDYRGLIPKGLAIDCTNLNIY